jgi:SAM-dependent methyltransferase
VFIVDPSIAQAISSLKEAILSLRPVNSWVKEGMNFFLVVGAIFTIYKILKEVGYQKRIFLEGQNLKEREAIRNRLDNFFAPLKELRAESRILYSHFAKDEKAITKKNKEKTFRTLRHLSQGKSFSEQDQAILTEIITVGKKQLALIEEKGCVLENSSLAELLGCLGAHIRLLSIAADRKLDGMSDKLEDIVFPLEVDGAVESEIRKLRDQYKALLDPSKTKKRNSVKLSKEQKGIISLYDQDAELYFRETAYIDMTDEYQKFRKQIPLAGTILDAGCGVGRDTRYFIKKGYRVISLDASMKMVNLCRQYPFSYCLHVSFNMIEYIEEFDGIWACASLIHLSPEDFKASLSRLANATKQGGILYFSLKNGTGITNNGGKITYHYTNNDIKQIMIEKLMFELVEIWENEGKKKTDSATWTNYIFKKPTLLQ